MNFKYGLLDICLLLPVFPVPIITACYPTLISLSDDFRDCCVPSRRLTLWFANFERENSFCETSLVSLIINCRTWSQAPPAAFHANLVTLARILVKSIPLSSLVHLGVKLSWDINRLIFTITWFLCHNERSTRSSWIHSSGLYLQGPTVTSSNLFSTR